MKFVAFKEIKIKDEDGVIFTGIRARRTLDGTGCYYVEALENPDVKCYITSITYEAIVSGERVTISL